MSHLPQDITDWLKKAKESEGRRSRSVELLERLGEYPSMAAVWSGSAYGPDLGFIVRVEGLETEKLKKFHELHLPKIKAAKKAAEAKAYTGPKRLQDLDPEYAEALAAHAKAIKALVANPFTT